MHTCSPMTVMPRMREGANGTIVNNLARLILASLACSSRSFKDDGGGGGDDEPGAGNDDGNGEHDEPGVGDDDDDRGGGGEGDAAGVDVNVGDDGGLVSGPTSCCWPFSRPSASPAACGLDVSNTGEDC